jgi:hypothetical protein
MLAVGLKSIQLGIGDHACHIYSGSQEQKAVLLPFLQEGIEKGEHCCYIASGGSVDDWYLEFQAWGVDVRQECDRSTLRILDCRGWHSTGDFKTLAKARDAVNLLTNRFKEFEYIRLACSATWAIDLPIETLCHWEATANLIYDGMNVRTVCEYDTDQLSPAAVHTALRTHPRVVLDGVVLDNPYYEAPWILAHEPEEFGSAATPGMIAGMLCELRATAP